MTTSFGVYSFNNVRMGETYIISVASKRYHFTPSTRRLDGSLTNLDFVGIE